MRRLLLIDKDTRLAVALSSALRRAGFQVWHVQTTAAASMSAGWDLVVMDPHADGDGFNVCRELRKSSAVGIVMLSAHGSEEDRVRALRNGADDYLTKPFSFAELHARLEAVLRRIRRPTPEIVDVGPLRVDIGRHQASVGADLVELTRKEFEVLAILARRPGAVVKREEFVSEVWPTLNGNGSRTLDVHVATLRAKIKDAVRVEAVRGVGYRMVPPSQDETEPEACWRLVVISPRFADAVVWAAGLIHRYAGTVAVVTVYGGMPEERMPPTDRDQMCGFTSAAEAVRVRAGEDVAACAVLNADTIHLPHQEGDDLDTLGEFLTGLPAATAVIAPAGLTDDPGYHRVRDVTWQLLRSGRERRFGFYADLPEAAPAHATGVEQRLRLDGREWSAKRRAVCSYASQLGLLAGRMPGLLAHPGPLQRESIWWIGGPHELA
ncbi:response regulator transcription factor [Nonomuraea sp. SYSU D8015]|uniref:response regulator transcription factor n=1 Tax=Nonomuraea sp. SYSU D8015 TaxID=2593644 RepID=UPI001660DD16|nr:response regulator transcription factor [Nonomuraea sp. SYSU D8015]